MRKFEYCSPTRIVFGSGAENETGRLARDCGAHRAFIVYGGGSAVKSGLIAKVEKSLASAGIEYEAMGGVVPNPVLSTARAMVAKASAFGADFILAVGGGSVIDTAKAVAHGTANPGTDVWDIWMHGSQLKKSLPIGAVLTIAAAGSETSDSAVITNDTVEPFSKRGLSVELNRCRFAVMDPDLTMTLPPFQVGAGAADIFMHTSERYFTHITGNHLTDEISEGLFRDIIHYGPLGVKDPHNYETMSEIMWCGSVSHIGLTGLGARGDTPRDGDWSCHQLGMAASALYDSTHGASLTAVWGAWARYVCGEGPDRFAQFGRKVYGISEPDDVRAAALAIEKTEDFFRALGMPTGLTALLGHAPSDDELKALADACSYGRTRSIGSFRVLGWDDMLNIYKACRN